MLVSVITPSYNRSETLPRAARSVSNQTYDAIEYIIVDDGSTDNTEAVVKQFEHPSLKYVKLERNKGVSTARNEGVRTANGEFVLFVDADDELPEKAVSLLVNELETASDRCAGVFGQQLFETSSGATERVMYNDDTVDYTDLCEENYLGAFGGKLIRRQLFEEIGWIDPEFPSSEDFDFFLRVAAAGYHFRYIDALVYYKYHHENRLFHNPTAKITGIERMLEKHGEELTPSFRAHRNHTIASIHAEQRRLDDAASSFRECLRLCPTTPKYHLLYLLVRLRIYNRVRALRVALANGFNAIEGLRGSYAPGEEQP